MLKAPIPDIMLPDIYALKPETLCVSGIRLLLMDLDNTLVPYGTETASVTLRNWVDALKKAGIEPYILSNNHGDRPESFARELFVGYTKRAKKPSQKTLRKVLTEKNVAPSEAAIIGDQIYTDILCGKRAGILTIAVRPISLKNPLLFLRYGLEFPFRKIGNRKKESECLT